MGRPIFLFRNKSFSLMLKFCYILFHLLHTIFMIATFVVENMN